MLGCGGIWLYQEYHTSSRAITALIVCFVLQIRFAGKRHPTGNRIHGGKISMSFVILMLLSLARDKSET